MTGFREASDRSLYIDFGDEISRTSHEHVVRLLRRLELRPLPGVLNLHPAYTSILVVFNPLITDHESLQLALTALAAECDDSALPPPRTVEIPVHYGGLDGPDLEDVAAIHGLSPHRVIELHSTAIYTVYFLGFVPGFAYMGGLPAEIATPRLPSPRTHVPAGSVGIAGNQTGVYPFITPGGWRLIGRTETRMFDSTRDEMSLLRAGDHVRFVTA